MSKAQRLQAVGFTPEKAIQLAIGPLRSSSAVTAAGTTLATATALMQPVNVVSTVAANTGVVLTSEVIDELVVVKNSGANTLNVYPENASTQINAIAAGSPLTLPTTKTALLFKVSATQWHAVQLD